MRTYIRPRFTLLLSPLRTPLSFPNLSSLFNPTLPHIVEDIAVYPPPSYLISLQDIAFYHPPSNPISLQDKDDDADVQEDFGSILDPASKILQAMSTLYIF
jgi:hypothetical protein